MIAEGVDPQPELGEPAESHMGVAAAVSAGAADAGLAVRAVADAAGLDWVPVTSEHFELAFAAEERATVEPLLTTLASSALQSRISQHPGYDLSMSGETRVAA
jgi:putative molybdopterin biosynthesis protein